MSPSTRLESISLKNYRCFENLTVEFDPQLTVLVAHNGAGKSTVLDAISVGLSAFIAGFDTGKRQSINHDDVRQQVIPLSVREVQSQYPAVLECQGMIAEQALQWERSKLHKNDRAYSEGHPAFLCGKGLMQAIASGSAETVLPLIAYYGTGRLWNEKKLTDAKSLKDQNTRTAGYLDCLHPSSSYRYFVKWLEETNKAHNEIRDQNLERLGDEGLKLETPYQALLKGVSLAVNACLHQTGWGNLRYSSIHKGPVIEHPIHGSLKVQQLSDGVRNMIAMVADIAYRALCLNKQLSTDAVQQTPGIVLIDEVDMHLHPEWQQKILGQLRTAFPEIQFIVTTHSPQVLSTIQSKHIRLLTTNTDQQTIAAIPLEESYARSNAAVLETIMHGSPIPPVKEKPLLAQYRTLIEQGDMQAAEVDQLKKKLISALGADHPELIQLDMIRQRREILG